MRVCPFCSSEVIKKHGWFSPKIRRTRIRRYYCKSCQKTFSSRTFAHDKYHKRVDLNLIIGKMLGEKNSLRGISRILGISYSTTFRKFLYLKEINSGIQTESSGSSIWIDEMESFEHTKLKPCTIAIAVDENHKLLAAKVGEIPSKGLIARISRRKYGLRKDESQKCMISLLNDLKQLNIENIYSDDKSAYKKHVVQILPGARHIVYKGKRNQELESRYLCKKEYDPLFPVNQKSRDLRDKVSRLARRTICNTKKLENLQGHLDIRTAYENGCLVY